MKTVYLLFICLVVSLSQAQNDCDSYEACDQCIRKSGCSWKIDNVENVKKCVFNKEVRDGYYSPGSSIRFLENLPLEGKTLVSPQRVLVNLRIGTPILFEGAVASKDESLVPPHHPNLSVQISRSGDHGVSVRLEAWNCPKDPKDYRQIINLPSTHGMQNIVLEVQFECTCPF